MAKDTRSRMLDATAKLLRQRGYYGTSLNDILAASGAPRGSLYFHFPGGKDQLVIEVTRASIDAVSNSLRKLFAEESTPARAVRKIIASIESKFRETDYREGCPIAPIALDATVEIPELMRLCRDAFESWIALLAEAFRSAGVPEARAYSLALLVESAIEGLMVISRSMRDGRPMPVVADELAALLESAVPKK